jgi:hypothetical protein
MLLVEGNQYVAYSVLFLKRKNKFARVGAAPSPLPCGGRAGILPHDLIDSSHSIIAGFRALADVGLNLWGLLKEGVALALARLPLSNRWSVARHA